MSTSYLYFWKTSDHFLVNLRFLIKYELPLKLDICLYSPVIKKNLSKLKEKQNFEFSCCLYNFAGDSRLKHRGYKSAEFECQTFILDPGSGGTSVPSSSLKQQFSV